MSKRLITCCTSGDEDCDFHNLEAACLYYNIVPEHLKKMGALLRSVGIDVSFREIEIEEDEEETAQLEDYEKVERVPPTYSENIKSKQKE